MFRSELRLLPGPSTIAASPRADAVMEAQRLGLEGARRGLREGAPALKRARTAYLSTEWSGDDDRRPSTGLLVRSRA